MTEGPRSRRSGFKPPPAAVMKSGGRDVGETSSISAGVDQGR